MTRGILRLATAIGIAFLVAGVFAGDDWLIEEGTGNRPPVLRHELMHDGATSSGYRTSRFGRL